MQKLALCITFLLTVSACGSDDSPPTASPPADLQNESAAETATGDESIPTDDDFNTGSSPTSCGAESQGLEPVDCTAYGDLEAQCVFSNHCYCSIENGFECEEKEDWMGDHEECTPGSSCIPIED